MTGLRDESHSLYITIDVFVPPYTASILAFALSISQAASLHVALTPSAGFCVQYSSVYFFFSLASALEHFHPFCTRTY